MAGRKEIQSFVGELNVGDKFTTAQLGSYEEGSGKITKALGRMKCVANTGSTKGHQTIIFTRAFDLEDDYNQALFWGNKGRKVPKRPQVCKGCPCAKTMTRACVIAKDQYWDKLK